MRGDSGAPPSLVLNEFPISDVDDHIDIHIDIDICVCVCVCVLCFVVLCCIYMCMEKVKCGAVKKI